MSQSHFDKAGSALQGIHNQKLIQIIQSFNFEVKLGDEVFSLSDDIDFLDGLGEIISHTEDFSELEQYFSLITKAKDDRKLNISRGLLIERLNGKIPQLIRAIFDDLYDLSEEKFQAFFTEDFVNKLYPIYALENFGRSGLKKQFKEFLDNKLSGQISDFIRFIIILKDSEYFNLDYMQLFLDNHLLILNSHNPDITLALFKYFNVLKQNQIYTDENKQTIMILIDLINSLPYDESNILVLSEDCYAPGLNALLNGNFTKQSDINHEVFHELGFMVGITHAHYKKNLGDEGDIVLNKFKAIIADANHKGLHPYVFIHQFQIINAACLYPTKENIEALIHLANQLEGHPSSKMQNFGKAILSFALALAVAAGILFFASTAPVAMPLLCTSVVGMLAGAGLFAYGKNRNGLSKDVLHLASALENSIALGVS